MKVLITGITGFAGSHLAEYILNNINDAEVCGTIRWRSKKDYLTEVEERINLFECELRDAKSVRDLIEHVKPDYIFHLAAQSFVPASWNSPCDTMINNTIGELNIFEAVRKIALTHCKIQIACSSEEYGRVYENELPITEENPLRPLSPYGVSKVAQDFLGYQYHQSYGLQIVRTRAFNHTGPRRGEVFVTSNFAKQIAEIEFGKKEPVVYVGNLEAKRDFTDVRDMVRGYWLALQKGEPGEVYQLCSGQTHTIREVLDTLLVNSTKEIIVKEDPARMRPSDVPVLLGTNERFHQATGWSPEIPFKETLTDLLNYWRGVLKN